MPYKDKAKDRRWHKEYMRKRRVVTPTVTPNTKASLVTIDAEGNAIPSYE